MRRATQTDRVLPARSGVGHARPAWQDDRQWPGPERGNQSCGKRRYGDGKVVNLLCASDMHDQRMVRRPALGRKNFGNGRIVRCIGTQTVNRLGRKRDQLAGVDAPGGFSDSRVCVRFKHGSFYCRGAENAEGLQIEQRDQGGQGVEEKVWHSDKFLC
jgi:hypothetical protein